MTPCMLIWLLISAISFADCVLLVAQGMTIVDRWFLVPEVIALCTASVLLRQRVPSVACAATAYAQIIAFSHASAILIYVVTAASPFPLADTLLSRADTALGFDWVAWFEFVRSHHTLQLLFGQAYSSIPAQVVILILYFAFRHPLRVDELLLATTLSVILLTPIMMLLPAIGEPSHNVVAATERWAEEIIALRTHTLTTIGTTDGIVYFPSFHTISGVLLVNMARGTRLFLPTLVLNLLMIASVSTEGSHYGVDALGGFALAFVTLAITQFLLARCSKSTTNIENDPMRVFALRLVHYAFPVFKQRRA